ncbi:MAG TPA: hypothetical protein VFZ21_31800 [Gemmatimonadaceae bacterium]|nr:hypothetical protein [Gemmatimonadaceae bacterium]
MFSAIAGGGMVRIVIDRRLIAAVWKSRIARFAQSSYSAASTWPSPFVSALDADACV